MAESQHAEGIIELDGVEQRKGPPHHQDDINQIIDATTTKQDGGPAPPTSIPPALIQEEHNAAITVAPIAENMPHIVKERSPNRVTPLNRLTEVPTYIDCPLCKTRAMTRIRKEGDSEQCLASVLCCLFCLCCACVPQLAGWCENVIITCTSCGKNIAIIPHNGPINVLVSPAIDQTEVSKY